MSFLALEEHEITDDLREFREGSIRIFLSPKPAEGEVEYPSVWFDLHLSDDDGYEICGIDRRLKFHCRDGECIFSVRPGASVRLITREAIGVKNDTTGVVVNSASKAVRGLSVAPGKVDPGFGPNKIVLVMTNHTRRAMDLRAGDKIAAIAFGLTCKECMPTRSAGWAYRKLNGYSAPWKERFEAWFRTNWVQVVNWAVSLIALAVSYLAWASGIGK